MTDCTTCQLVDRRDAGTAPLWDAIVRTEHWDLVHSFNTSIEGWLVLVCRRHIATLAEMTDAESDEVGRLVRDASRALHEVTGCDKTYVAQFAESADHRHVHIHLIARHAAAGDDTRGPLVFSALGADDEHRVSDERMNELALAIRAELGVATSD